MRLSKKALDLIKENHQIKTALAYHLNKSVHTIEVWVKDNSVYLTTADALKIIKDKTKLKDSEVLEKEVA